MDYCYHCLVYNLFLSAKGWHCKRADFFLKVISVSILTVHFFCFLLVTLSYSQAVHKYRGFGSKLGIATSSSVIPDVQYGMGLVWQKTNHVVRLMRTVCFSRRTLVLLFYFVTVHCSFILHLQTHRNEWFGYLRNNV